MTLAPPEPALVALLAELDRAGYRFTAITPATHNRVVARPDREKARDLRDVFGWSLPFEPGFLPPAIADALAAAGAVERRGSRLKSRLRAASLGGDLFLHSAFPTEADDSVFFGPDTYRYAALLRAELPAAGRVERLVDVGAGGGAGGIVAARLVPDARIVLADLNPAALRLAAANAAHAGVAVERVLGAGLDAVAGSVDCVIANPPFMMDEAGRAYRSGGGLGGAALSLDWALAAAERLEPGGRMILYTGVAMAGTCDPLREALEEALAPLGCALAYRELDPDIFGEELDRPPYREIERIAAVAAVIAKAA